MDEDVTQLLEGHTVMNDHDLNSIPSALLKGGPGSETHEWTCICCQSSRLPQFAESSLSQHLRLKTLRL